jgi:hypothetical protein
MFVVMTNETVCWATISRYMYVYRLSPFRKSRVSGTWRETWRYNRFIHLEGLIPRSSGTQIPPETVQCPSPLSFRHPAILLRDSSFSYRLLVTLRVLILTQTVVGQVMLLDLLD